MNKKEFIEDVVLEWAFRLKNGQPDLLNESHLILLQDILYEKNIPTEFVFEWLNNIRVNSNENLNSVTTAAFLSSVNTHTHTSRSLDAYPLDYRNDVQPTKYIVPDDDDDDAEEVEENVEKVIKQEEQTEIDEIKDVNKGE